ncbi:MAG: VOC family protein [Xanthomonadaceae bacterium]|nr:VOC family protein [Xanthomonadaceae bacterium]
MTITLDHIGIAVNDLPQVKKLFEILGLKASGTEHVADQGVQVHFLKPATATTNIELLQVEDPEGTVAKFIAKRGPGVHHLSFRVETGKLDSLSKELLQAGYKLIYPSPKIGAHQMRINFIHPSTTGGLLIEIMEASSK